MKKILAVVGVLLVLGIGLKLYLYNETRETPVSTELQTEVADAAAPASNASEVVTLEGEAIIAFPDRKK